MVVRAVMWLVIIARQLGTVSHGQVNVARDRRAVAGIRRLRRSPQPCRSIRHQIVVVAQSVLDVERRAGRCVRISSARGKYTQGPIILSALIRDVIYCDVADV